MKWKDGRQQYFIKWDHLKIKLLKKLDHYSKVCRRKMTKNFKKTFKIRKTITHNQKGCVICHHKLISMDRTICCNQGFFPFLIKNLKYFFEKSTKSLRVSPVNPFDWKFLKIASVIVYNFVKNFPNIQEPPRV